MIFSSKKFGINWRRPNFSNTSAISDSAMFLIAFLNGTVLIYRSIELFYHHIKLVYCSIKLTHRSTKLVFHYIELVYRHIKLLYLSIKLVYRSSELLYRKDCDIRQLWRSICYKMLKVPVFLSFIKLYARNHTF